MITLENPVLNQPLVTPSTRACRGQHSAPCKWKPRTPRRFPKFLERLPDPPPSRPSSSPCLSPFRPTLPTSHSAFLHARTQPPNPRSRDVQHYDGTAAVAASSQPSLLRPCQPFPDSPYPYPTFSVNGFHRRGPHSLGCSSPFLPLSRFLSVFLLPFLRS